AVREVSPFPTRRSSDLLQKFEKSARNMHSLARYSRANQINKEWIERYLNEAHSFGLSSIRAHFNVIAWSDDPSELKQLRNDCGRDRKSTRLNSSHVKIS